MVTLKHFGKIVKGKRLYYNPDLHSETIASLEGQEFEEVIKLKHKKVSTDAYGYYYGCVIKTALEFELFGGWDKEDVDDFFTKKFLTYHKTVCLKYTDVTEDFSAIPKTPSKGQGFSSNRMKEYTDRCIMWLAENGIIVPPSENFIAGKYKTEVKNV